MTLYRIEYNKIYSYEVIRETDMFYVIKYHRNKYVPKTTKSYFKTIEEAVKKLEPILRDKLKTLKKELEDVTIAIDSIVDGNFDLLKAMGFLK